MTLLIIAGKAIGGWLQHAIVSLAPPPAHTDRNDWTEYYRFPMF